MSPSGCTADMRRIDSWSAWPCSVYCPPWRRSGASSASSTTRSGWIGRRCKSSPSSRAAVGRVGRDGLRCAYADQRSRTRRSPASPSRPRRRGCPGLAGLGGAGALDDSADRISLMELASRDDSGGSGVRLRAAFDSSDGRPDRTGICPSVAVVSVRHTASLARCGGRAGRRRGGLVASGPSNSESDRTRPARPRPRDWSPSVRGHDSVTRSSAPRSAAELTCVRYGRRTAGSPMRPIRTLIRIDERGIAPTPRRRPDEAVAARARARGRPRAATRRHGRRGGIPAAGDRAHSRPAGRGTRALAACTRKVRCGRVRRREWSSPASPS